MEKRESMARGEPERQCALELLLLGSPAAHGRGGGAIREAQARVSRGLGQFYLQVKWNF